ncbi:MAG: alpha/beta hydrolase [Legionellaceae bacterium]|nr:alpha/beta hydrolase [Legionellaceae bacterium]
MNERQLIHFAHGNGFPAPCYRQMLNQLALEHDLCWIEKIGHDPRFPVTDNWHTLVDELIDNIQRQAALPLIAMGHSLGGILSLVAAIERPDLIKAVIMIDAPLIGRFKSSMVKLAKALGIIDRVTPAYRTKGRRTHWQHRAQVLQYLEERPLFQTFSQACREDYVDHGLIQTQEGYALAFERHIEYHIYRTLPHTLPRYKGLLRVPAVLIYGQKSSVVDRLDRHYMKKHYAIESIALPGTHMLPMEIPERVAHTALAWLRTQ